MKNTLKHWGIFGMKWGIRRFQNEDGSLTPEGRLRYGVGPAKNLHGVNDGSSLSDDKLRKMTKRYRAQADYYKSRNDYIYQEKQFKENTIPKKIRREHTFLKAAFGQPLTNFISKNFEFGLRMIGVSFLDHTGSPYASLYTNYMFGNGKKDDDKNNKNEKPDNLEPVKKNQKDSFSRRTDNSKNIENSTIIFDSVRQNIGEDFYNKPWQDYVNNLYTDDEYQILLGYGVLEDQMKKK